MRPSATPTPVNQDNLKKHVAQLVAHGARHTEPTAVAAALEYLKKCVSEYGYTAEVQTYGPKPHEVNVWCELPGTRVAPALEIGAHWDTVKASPGADDNASGVAGVLELARVLKADRDAGHSLGRTVRFLFFGGEEDYELGTGSREHLRTADPRPDGAIVLEMIGYRSSAPGSQEFPPQLTRLIPGVEVPTTGNFIAAIGIDNGEAPINNATGYIDELNSAAKKHDIPMLAVKLPGGPDYTTYSIARSDHRSYWTRGIKAVMVTDTAELRNKAYHKENDVYETLDFQFAEKVTSTVADAVRVLAV